MDITREAIESAHEDDHAATTVHLGAVYLSDHPNDLAVIGWCADMLCQMARYDEAIESLANAIDRQDADFPRHLLLLEMGGVERHRGNFAESENWYRKAIELRPDDASGYVFLGGAQARQGRLRQAEATHRDGTQCVKGAIDESFHNLGLVLRGQGRLEEAADCFRAAIEIEPEYDAAIKALEDVEMALQLLARKDALTLSPCRGNRPPLPPKEIRDAYRDDHAASCVLLAEQWLRDHPDDLVVTHYYATMLYEMTHYEEAMSVYDDAIERFLDHRWGIFNQLGHLHDYRGALAEAETSYKQAIEEDPEEAASYIFLGAVQARQGKLKEAEDSHRLATQCPEGFIHEAYYNLGFVLRGQGRLADAQACFEKAIEISDEYNDAIEALNDVMAAIEMEGAV